MSTTKHFDIVEHQSPCQHIRQYPRATAHSEEDELFLAVKQYVPRDRVSEKHSTSVGITLIACHADGCPKELYEPLWDALYEYMQTNSAVHISGIWIADYANSGQSGILNEKNLGNEPSFYDHARDYLAMVNHFRKDMNQPIVGFGHSMGGNVLLSIALLHPRMFTTVITFEPTIYANARQVIFLGAYPLTFRKDMWPSREAAEKSLRKHPLYKTWIPDVLDLYLKYGLRDLPTPLYQDTSPQDAPTPVTLTTTKHQEVLNYARAAYPPSRSTPLSDFIPTRSAHPEIGNADWRHPKEPFYRPETTQTFLQLPYLRPSCLWLYGADTIFMPEKWKRAEKTAATGTGLGGSGGVAAGRVEEREVAGGGHFMPFEAPRVLSTNALGPWLVAEVDRWAAETRKEREAWQKVDAVKRSQYGEDWEYWMKKHNDPRKVSRKARLQLKL